MFGDRVIASTKAVRGRPERELWIDAELSGHVDDRKQQIADLAEALLGILGLGQLDQLLARRVERRLQPREVKPARRRPALHLPRV